MDKNSVEYSGIEKTMILIRSDLFHEVKEKMTDELQDNKSKLESKMQKDKA